MFDMEVFFKSFLGANTAKGFVSYFADSYNVDEGYRTYIIKGGPGTGKSTMLKTLAALFSSSGESIELCPCSSDPDSLDAVIFHDKKVVILDGTAPHIVDPAYPGICERIINLGECFIPSAFSGKEKQIIEATRENKRLHSRASRYIAAAGGLLAENALIAGSFMDEEKIKRYAKTLAERTIKQGTAFCESHRFLSGITPRGLVFLKQSIYNHYKTIITLEDEHGAVGRVFFSELRKAALSANSSIITCYNTIIPSKIDHILLPEQSLAFTTENRYTHPEGITKRIHARRFCDMAAMGEKRETLKFNRKAAEELLREAIKIIAAAKSVHDELESYYIAAMDFEKSAEILNRIAGEI